MGLGEDIDILVLDTAVDAAEQSVARNEETGSRRPQCTLEGGAADGNSDESWFTREL